MLIRDGVVVGPDVPDRATRQLGVVRSPARAAVYAGSLAYSMADGIVSPAGANNFVSWKFRNPVSGLVIGRAIFYRLVLFSNTAKRCQLRTLEPPGADLTTGLAEIVRSIGFTFAVANRPVIVASRQSDLAGSLGGSTFMDVRLEANKPLPVEIELVLDLGAPSAFVVEFGADGSATTDQYMCTADWYEE